MVLARSHQAQPTYYRGSTISGELWPCKVSAAVEVPLPRGISPPVVPFHLVGQHPRGPGQNSKASWDCYHSRSGIGCHGSGPRRGARAVAAARSTLDFLGDEVDRRGSVVLDVGQMHGEVLARVAESVVGVAERDHLARHGGTAGIVDTGEDLCSTTVSHATHAI